MDYEQLYYDEKYKNKKLLEKVNQLEEEISILKGNKKLVEYIIKQLNDRKNSKNNSEKSKDISIKL